MKIKSQLITGSRYCRENRCHVYTMHISSLEIDMLCDVILYDSISCVRRNPVRYEAFTP